MDFSADEIVSAVCDPALVLWSDGTIIAGNAAVATALGCSRSDLVGQAYPRFVEEPPEQVLRYLSLCSRSRESLPGKFTWRRGAAREARLHTMLLRPRSADAHAVLLLRLRTRDETSDHFISLNLKIAELSKEIRDRLKAEQERDELIKSERAARLAAEQSSRLKDEFVATLSHELRTPLSAILGWVQLLRTGRVGVEETRQGLEVIERNTRAQSHMIDELLDISRIISGKVRLDVQRLDLAQVIEAAIESIQPAAEAKGVRIQKLLDPLAGPVTGDPNRLQQVFWNLLSNAVKFTPKGGRIQIHLERVNSHVEVSVRDTGQGIAPEFLPHVFDRFSQADSSTTRSFGGLGLGLAIVRHLVELHGGEVRAKSPGHGKGSTFVIQLPITVIHDESEQRPHPRAPDEHVPFEPPDLSGLSILAVDDEVDGLMLVKRLLEECQCRVHVASSAVEGYELLRQHRPDVLISDLEMPHEDGYSFMKRVRGLPAAEGGNTPAIALSAFARSEDRRRAMLAGFQLHMAKPIDFPELIASVASVSGRTSRLSS